VSHATVIAAHVASYANPIELRAGERATLTGSEDIWDGHRWLWAIAPDGRQGWVPDTLLDTHGRAIENYSAVEQTCKVGAELKTSHYTHGWHWCTDKTDAQGWVPSRSLELHSIQ